MIEAVPPQTVDSPATGMEAVKAVLAGNPPGQRSIAWLAKQLGLTRGAVLQWSKVPEDRIADVSRLTGIAPSLLRPDLAALFAAVPHESAES